MSRLSLQNSSKPGDAQSFTQAFDRHGRAVFRYAFSLAHDRDAAHDIVQETFLTAWSRRSELDFSAQSFVGWLLVTCRYQYLNHDRRAVRRETIPLDEALELPENAALDPVSRSVETNEELKWVMAAIDGLTELDRRVVELCIFEELSYSDASAQLGISLDGVTKRVSRTRAKLRSIRNSQTLEGSESR